MRLLLISLVVFCVSMLAMAVGVLAGRPAIRGSCGGLAGLCDDAGRPLCLFCPNRKTARAASGETCDEEVTR